MKKTILTVLWVASLTLGFTACGDDDDGGETGSSPAVAACQADCQAKEEAGCGEQGVAACNQICGALIGRLDADCQAKAEASFKCDIENDEVCGGRPDELSCRAETDAFNVCLSNR